MLAFAALFVILGGTATAAALIDGKNIKAGTVTSKQIKDRFRRFEGLQARAVAGR